MTRAKKLMLMLTWGVLVLLAAGSATAQPDWLKTSIAQSSGLQTASDATALILLNSADVSVKSSGEVGIHCRRATKILKTAGKDLAIFAEPLNPYREVKNLKGWLVNSGGDVTSLSRDNVAKVAVGQAAGYYDDAFMSIASFDMVPVGSTIGYEYDVTEKDPLLGAFVQAVFQVQQPVVAARLTVTLPENWRVQSRIINCDSCRSSVSGNVYEWWVANLPYRPEEPLMPAWSALSRKVLVSCFGPSTSEARSFDSWSSAASWAASQLDSSANPDPVVSEFTKQLVAGDAPTIDKVRAIADFVRQQIRYVAVELGNGRVVPRPAAKTLAARFGDCKDKVALMRSMLATLGIPSKAVLACTDKPVLEDICHPFQFNHCIIAIPLDQLSPLPEGYSGTCERWLFFDPTHPALSLGKIPEALHGSFVLIASVETTAPTHLPNLDELQDRRVYRVDAALNDGGGFDARVTIIDYGNRGDEVAYWSQNTGDNEEIDAIRKRLASHLGTVNISDFKVEPADDSMTTTLTVRSDSYLTASGDTYLLRVDPIHSEATTRLRDKPRQSDLELGAHGRIETEVTWRLGRFRFAGTAHETLADSCRVATTHSKLDPGDSVVVYRSVVSYDGDVLRPDEYSVARGFQQTLEKIRSAKVTLRRGN